MLNMTLEFLRICDPQPTDEKVRKRRESAQELVGELKQNHNTLLDFLQGIVAGFGLAPFTQVAPAITLLIKSIKDRDETLPLDLKENALELRAVAAIAVGELLIERPGGAPTDEAVLAAHSIGSALSIRPSTGEKYTKWMLDTLSKASDEVLQQAAEIRRKPRTTALAELESLKLPPTDPCGVLGPAVKSAIKEVKAQTAVDREEIETLWWMFGGYSEIEQKPLIELSPVAAAFCSGLELASRALLPASPSSAAMVRRAVMTDRKPAALRPVPLQEATKDWSASLLAALAPNDGSRDQLITQHPALLPLSWACRRLGECAAGPQELGKDFSAATGIPLNLAQTPMDWGAQVFHEKILQRIFAETEEG